MTTLQHENQREVIAQSSPDKTTQTNEPRRLGRAPARIRPELTIEKWPAIWHPSKSKSPAQVRVFERRVPLSDGTPATAKVEVGFTQLGNLTTEDQKTYYGLIQQWESSGRPAEQTFFSTRKLAKALRKRWGTNVIESTTESLRRLRTTPFAWTNSYHDSATGEELEILDTFTILADLKIIRRKTDGNITHAAGHFRFHDMILKNLFANHTKPLHFDVILGFKSEIAQLLYVHVDLMLARSDHYERRTKELFEDLGLRGTAYRKPSNRKQQLDRALRELNGVPLSTGLLSSATISRTANLKDFKVIFHKTTHRRTPARIPPQQENRAEGIQENAARNKDPLTLQAGELVSHFHRVFHRLDKSAPSSKETGQAIALIASHGLDQARHLVTFSHYAAAQTNYCPQTFGGILQYTSRALADYDATKREERHFADALAERKAEELRERESLQKIDERLNKLSQPEYTALYQKVRAEIIESYPRLNESQGTLLNAAIRARMVRELEARPDEIKQIL